LPVPPFEAVLHRATISFSGTSERSRLPVSRAATPGTSARLGLAEVDYL